MPLSSPRLIAVVVAIGAITALGIAHAATGPTPYQRCVTQVSVFLSSPAGQMDAGLLGGYPPHPGAFRAFLIGECHAKYGALPVSRETKV